MKENQLTKLPDHEVLAKLARDDPQAFEALRFALIEERINSAPDRIKARLRGIQFQVDGIRRLSRSALGATVKIHALMWESFLQMNDNLQGVARPTGALPGSGHPGSSTRHAPAEYRPARSARIIEFQPRPSRVRGSCAAELEGAER